MKDSQISKPKKRGILWPIFKFKNQWHLIKKYGLRYYYDKKYYKKIRNKLFNIRKREKYGNKFLYSIPIIKDRLIERDGFRCQLCKYTFKRYELTIDHIIPVSKGGTNRFSNLQLLCKGCHVYKDNQKNQIKNPIIKEQLEKLNLIKK